MKIPKKAPRPPAAPVEPTARKTENDRSMMTSPRQAAVTSWVPGWRWSVATSNDDPSTEMVADSPSTHTSWSSVSAPGPVKVKGLPFCTDVSGRAVTQTPLGASVSTSGAGAGFCGGGGSEGGGTTSGSMVAASPGWG